MIYLFHHHELPTILHQARIQLLLQRNQHGGMHGAGLNANLNLNVQDNIPPDIAAEEPQGDPQGGAEVGAGGGTTGAGHNTGTQQGAALPNRPQGQATGVQAPPPATRLASPTIWQFHLGSMLRRRVNVSVHANQRYPPGTGPRQPTPPSNKCNS